MTIIAIVIVSFASTIVAALVQSLPAIESADQPEGETAQSSDSSDIDYTQFKISPCTSTPGTTTPTLPQDP